MSLSPEIRFWLEAIEDAKQTILCPSDIEPQIRTYMDSRGMGGAISVCVSSSVPKDRIFVLPGHLFAPRPGEFSIAEEDQ